jgi:siroheme synthase-like protein
LYYRGCDLTLNRLYPIQLSLTGKRVLIVGGGGVAYRKAKGLCSAGARVTVVAPEILPEIAELSEVELTHCPYEPGLAAGYALVFACSDQAEVNQLAARDARETGIWCNVADDPEAGDFHVPASARLGRLTLAVGTDGGSPRLAAFVRDVCVKALPRDIAAMADEVAAYRAEVLDEVSDESLRRELINYASSNESIGYLIRHGAVQWRKRIAEADERETDE